MDDIGWNKECLILDAIVLFVSTGLLRTLLVRRKAIGTLNVPKAKA